MKIKVFKGGDIKRDMVKEKQTENKKKSDAWVGILALIIGGALVLTIGMFTTTMDYDFSCEVSGVNTAIDENTTFEGLNLTDSTIKCSGKGSIPLALIPQLG